MRLFRIEFLKLSQDKSTWVLLGVYFALLLLCMTLLQAITDAFIGSGSVEGGMGYSIYSFPDSWHMIAFIASWFKIIPAIAIVMLVCNEYTYKTLRAQIINGLSRTEFFIGKLLLILSISGFSTLILLVIGLILGFRSTEDPSFTLVTEKLPFLGVYFLQVFGYMLFAFLLAILLKKNGLTIGLLLLYSFPIEPLIDWAILQESLEGFLPLESFQELIPWPVGTPQSTEEVATDLNYLQLGTSLVYCILFSAGILFVLHKRDQ